MSKNFLLDVGTQNDHELGGSALALLHKSGIINSKQYETVSARKTFQRDLGYLVRYNADPLDAFKKLSKGMTILRPGDPLVNNDRILNVKTGEEMEVQIIKPRFSDPDTTFTALLVIETPEGRKKKGKHYNGRRHY